MFFDEYVKVTDCNTGKIIGYGIGLLELKTRKSPKELNVEHNGMTYYVNLQTCRETTFTAFKYAEKEVFIK